MGKVFSVEIRKDCKVCGEKITNPRSRTFCSKKCRDRSHAKERWAKHREEGIKQNRENLERRRRAKYGNNLIKCRICGKSFVKVGAHVVQVHNMTARQYREEYGFDVKRGQVIDEHREHLAEAVYRNHSVVIDRNLAKGKKYRFKKGQPGIGTYQRSPETMARLKKHWKKVAAGAP